MSIIRTGKGLSFASDGNKVILTLLNNKSVSSYSTFFQPFGKKDLEKSMDTVYKMLKCAEVEYSEDSENSIISMMNKMLKNKPSSLYKDDLLLLMSSLCSHFRNLKQLVMLDKTGSWLKLWTLLASTTGVDLSEAKKILGHSLDIYTTSGWNPRYMSDALIAPASFSYSEKKSRSYHYYGDLPDQIFIPQAIRTSAVTVFCGENLISPNVSAEIHGSFAIADYEKYLFDDCIYLSGLRSCNAITSATGAITATKVKSISAKLTSPDFPDVNMEYPVHRKNLLILSYARCSQDSSQDVEIDAGTLVKYIANSFGRDLVSSDYSIMLPKFKGFTKNLTEYSRAFSISRLVDKLIANSSQGWLDMQNFPIRYLCNDNIITVNAAFSFLFNLNDYNRYSLRFESQPAYERAIDVSLWEDITLPYIIHYIKLLCAVGMIQIAYDPDSVDDEMEGIRFIRMTKLGRYAYGFDKNYEFRQESTVEQFELEKDTLLITVLNPNSPYIIFLEQFGKRISNNRFHISATEIVRKAVSKEQVKQWVENFKKIICPNPQGVWKEMLEEVDRRLEAGKIMNSMFSVVHIDTNVPGIVQFISGDPDIRTNVILAQRGYLLVYNNFLPDFITKLKKAGFML